MPDGIRWSVLDVHARASTLAEFAQATCEVTTKRVVGRPHELCPGCAPIGSRPTGATRSVWRGWWPQAS